MTQEEWLSIFLSGPEVSADMVEECRQSGEWMPYAFEVLKHVGGLCSLSSHLNLYRSPIVKQNTPIHYAVLTGQMHRCAKLILSCLRLTHDGTHGETYFILERCIIETIFRMRYLIKKNSDEMFNRFICSGLQKDVEALECIRENIRERGGSSQPIEDRMTTSIERYLTRTNVTEAEVKTSSVFPDYRSILREFNLDTGYTFLQGIPSQSIHGTWSSLLTSYLEYGDDGLFHPAPLIQEPSPGQVLTLAFMTYAGLIDFYDYVLQDADVYVELVDSLERYHDATLAILNEV